ncbi:MAG: tRNA-queuosine alpha-mannosyltransferase domain-containing protein [Candidatus Anammoxibacter sp.]
MDVLLIEPFYTGSHACWAEGYKEFSSHNVTILNLKGQFWKWRMHGGAITLARKFLDQKCKYDLILVTDMLDLTIFQALTREATYNTPFAIYFHENQMSYPWSPTDRDVIKKRDRHYSFINFSSALAADKVYFNSLFHKNVFFEELRRLLKGFPDNNELESIETIKNKSEVLQLGFDFARLDDFKEGKTNKKPLILWNHRWEYDKNPKAFFEALYILDQKGLEFEVVVLGENFSQKPEEFLDAKDKLKGKIAHFGYVSEFAEYAKWLWRSDIIPITSNHDFFCRSLVESMHCNCYPILPNRLVFPEHIPDQFHDEFFYNDKQELIDKLEFAIMNIDQIRERDVDQFVKGYNWDRMAPIYDESFSNLCSSRVI